MEPNFSVSKEDIESGEYFKRAADWYGSKYLEPFSQRSATLILCVITFVVFFGISMSVHYTLPVVKKVKYLVSGKNISSTEAKITKAAEIDSDPYIAVAKIMLKDYLVRRESYDYDKLRPQFNFMENTSTRLVFKKFYDSMNIDNENSPVLRYQKYVRRSVEIQAVNYISKGQAEIYFGSSAKSSSGETLESMVWKARLNFEMDDISYNIPPGTRFNFKVTDYEISPIRDNLKKAGSK